MRIWICGGTIVDGSGEAPYKADLLVENGCIADVGVQAPPDADIIDASGMLVTPGFIDIHRHCDAAVLRDPAFGEIELAQGITTAVAGNCGLAPVPVSRQFASESTAFLRPVMGEISAEQSFEDYESYFSALEKAHPRINIGLLAGSGAIKTCIKGFGGAPYSPSEIEQAAGYVRRAMEAGAFGVSLGIMYPPECYSTADEISRIIKPAAQENGVLTAHIRGEGDLLVESVREVILIAELAGIRLHISHFKATGIRNWNNAIYKAIEEIENARARGLPVTVDFYPYDGGATTLLSLVPPSMLSDGSNNLRRLSSKEGKELFAGELAKEHQGWENMAVSIGWDRILIASTSLPGHESFGGKSISQLAAERGVDPVGFVADLLAAEGPGVGIIVLSMAQNDIDSVARLPYSAVISDALYGGGSNPHPRLLGAQPKLLREYVRERGILPLQTAINKMTALPSDILRLGGRGLLLPGYDADINIFDPKLFRDNAEYTGPKEPACGMHTVMIRGRIAYSGGALSPQASARILRRQNCVIN